MYSGDLILHRLRVRSANPSARPPSRTSAPSTTSTAVRSHIQTIALSSQKDLRPNSCVQRRVRLQAGGALFVHRPDGLVLPAAGWVAPCPLVSPNSSLVTHTHRSAMHRTRVGASWPTFLPSCSPGISNRSGSAAPALLVLTIPSASASQARGMMHACSTTPMPPPLPTKCLMIATRHPAAVDFHCPEPKSRPCP